MREMTLEIEKDFLNLINSDSDLFVKVVSCRPHLDKGMTEFVELISNSPVQKAVDRIMAHPNTASATFKTFDESRASGIITTNDSPLCRTISSLGGFCKSCPLEMGSSQKSKVKWKVVFQNNSSLNSFLDKLGERGINPSTADAGDLKENGLLTLREERSIRLAQELGYFQFPRKTSLRKLSALLGISPSTLDEILRRAEHKIIKGHIRKPNGTDSQRKSENSGGMLKGPFN